MMKVSDTMSFYKDQRQHMDDVMELIYGKSVQMAEGVGVEPCKPRTAGRQKHRSNIIADTQCT